jgi:hypothetical protein
MATARQATLRWRRHDGDGATGNEVNDDGDGTMSSDDDGDGATGDEVDDDGDDDDSGNGRRRQWRWRDGRHVDGDGTTGNKDNDDGSS